MSQAQMLIGGERVVGVGAVLEVENPYTEQTIEAVPSASPEQLDAAVAAASEARGVWGSMPAVDRAELLHEVATRLRDNVDAIAETMTIEGGKPLVENRDEIGWTAAAFDYYAELGRDSAGRLIPPIESTQLALVMKEPIGVVACIVPWNYPLLLLAWKLAPALAAGDTTVCKLSEVTPLATGDTAHSDAPGAAIASGACAGRPPRSRRRRSCRRWRSATRAVRPSGRSSPLAPDSNHALGAAARPTEPRVNYSRGPL